MKLIRWYWLKHDWLALIQIHLPSCLNTCPPTTKGLATTRFGKLLGEKFPTTVGFWNILDPDIDWVELDIDGWLGTITIPGVWGVTSVGWSADNVVLKGDDVVGEGFEFTGRMVTTSRKRVKEDKVNRLHISLFKIYLEWKYILKAFNSYLVLPFPFVVFDCR